MTEPALVAHRSPPRHDPGEEFHLFCCCDQNLGLCGADLTGLPVNDGAGEDRCLACFMLEDATCPWCGCDDCEVDA